MRLSPARRAGWIVLVLGPLLAGGRGARAQGVSASGEQSTAPTQRSSYEGIYTAAQAARGKDVYAGYCKSCHSPASHTGVTFANWWKGKTVADLYLFMSARMPKNDPGSLDPGQYADVVAYLLKMNAMPAGTVELPPDTAALAAIRIDTGRPTARSTRTKKRGK